MNPKPHVVALVVALVAATPTVSALQWDFWNDAPDPPRVDPPSYAADLSAAEGKIQVTQLTGLTSLTVLEFVDVSMFILPQADQLLIRQVPKTDTATRAISSTTVNLTQSLTLTSTPYHTWIDGAGADNPAQLDTDPSYILAYSVPDVSIPNVVALTDLKPVSKTGPATMTTLTHSYVSAATAAVSSLDWTLIDLDDESRLVETGPTYEPTATITSATTSLGIKSLLDEFSLGGVDLAGVLSGLKLSTEKVGVVNLDATSQMLASDGYTIRKVAATSVEPQVVVQPLDNRIDFVRPAELDGNLVLLSTDELADVDEGKLTALKDAENPNTTRVLSQFRKPDLSVCTCLVVQEYSPDAGGVSDGFASLAQAEKRLEAGVTRFHVDPAFSGPYLPPVPSEDFAQLGSRKEVYLNDAGALSVQAVESVLREPSRSAVDVGDMPTVKKNELVLLNRPDPRLKEADYGEIIKESIEAWRVQYPTFDLSFCTTGCLPSTEAADLATYLGQLETFDPRLDLALPDLDYPDDFLTTTLTSTGTLLAKASAAGLNQETNTVYATLQLRVLRDQTRLPIGDAKVELNVLLPGWKGSTVQTYTATTNGFGYAVFSVLPGMAYNFTVTKTGFSTAGGVGASPPPGETQGKEVRMTATEGVAKLVERFGTPVAVASFLLLAVLGVVLLRRLRRRRGGKGRR